MTINSLQLNTSAPFVGLGTATYNVVTTGLYTCKFKSFLPYFAAGTPAQSSLSTNGSVDITVTGDTAGSLNSTFFTFHTAGDLYGYYVWYNINSAGVDPTPAGLTGIQVSAATGADSTAIGLATRTAIAAATNYVTITGATSHVIIGQNNPGTYTVAANGTASPGFSYSDTQGSYGSPAQSGLNVVIKNGTTVLGSFGWPSPTQPLIGGSVIFAGTAADVITLTTSSLSTADAGLNAVKSIINIYSGE